jgi:hypothetical protein
MMGNAEVWEAALRASLSCVQRGFFATDFLHQGEACRVFGGQVEHDEQWNALTGQDSHKCQL